MATKAYLQAIINVKKRAKQGFRLSELSGVEKVAAEKLIDRGVLDAAPIGRGDYVVSIR